MRKGWERTKGQGAGLMRMVMIDRGAISTNLLVSSLYMHSPVLAAASVCPSLAIPL